MIPFSYKSYVAVIGDIKKSRELNERKAVQEQLKNVLAMINDSYKNDISSNFIITLGDEFQGLLNCGANIMQIISEIERNMYPVDIRFGIGVGVITTKINREMAIGADGPAYYMARAAIDFLKGSENKNQTDTPDIRFEFDTDNKTIVEMINTVMILLSVIKRSWSPRQREVIEDMLLYRDSQVNVAKRLKIQQPTVQKILVKGKYYAYKEAMDNIEKILGEIIKE